MVKSIRVITISLKRAMPKFYHGRQLGFAYKARAVGWRRIPLLSFVPYLTGDIIQIHLSLKSLIKGQEWQQGILHIEPPDMSKEPVWEGGTSVPLSDNPFSFADFGKWPRELSTPPKYQFPVDKWWSRTLSIKGGVPFGQPCNFECSLILQNIDHRDNKVEMTVPIRIADIEIVSRGPFVTNVLMWVLGLIIAGLLGHYIK
jgi:hypothetical protein